MKTLREHIIERINNLSINDNTTHNDFDGYSDVDILEEYEEALKEEFLKELTPNESDDE